MSEHRSNAGYYNAEAACAAEEQVSFSFGENWKKYLARFDEDRLAHAERSLVDFNKLPRLDEFDFLDVGSGSGLSSLAALRLGARQVVSVDIDPHSIDCTRQLRGRFQIPETRWQIVRGSVLDVPFMQSLGRFSYVHSWGVLQFTGAMWQALANLMEHSVAENGLLHVAVYNEHPTSKYWLQIKRLCNRSPRFWSPLIKWSYISALFGKMTITGRSPWRFLREYKSRRGMDFYRDIDDWIGGLPYEYASPAKTVDFIADRNFSILRIRTVDSPGCNEFLCRRLGDTRSVQGVG
jgi:2-polyprenyl-6-hydroxyphenyl methylase/3-demethylubiquinone-9 3-methyltransferase